MALKKILYIALASGFLLAGCTGNGEENSMNQANKSEEIQSSIEQSTSSSSVEIVGTDQYGRGAKSDGQDTNRTEEPMRILTEDADAIIIYFSRSGNTENLVKMIYNETNADVLELTLSEPYREDYEETVARANEERDSGNFPEINTEIPDFSQYDRIFLGYQTWAMTLSNPIISFLETNGELIDGKTIYPFSSNAGYGEGNSLQRMQEMLPNSTIKESFAVEDEAVVSSQNELVEWVERISRK